MWGREVETVEDLFILNRFMFDKYITQRSIRNLHHNIDNQIESIIDYRIDSIIDSIRLLIIDSIRLSIRCRLDNQFESIMSWVD